MTPARATLGCGNLITLLGGFGSGIYLGLNKAKGIEIDPLATKALFAGPSIIAGFLGFAAGTDYARDPAALDEVVAPPIYSVPEEMRGQAQDQMKGCIQGCAPIGGAISSTVFTGITTAIGYYIGTRMG